jgi:N-acetylglucosaminyl-diphospho-decaprenol L-rhamnosyltransferase
MNKKKNILDIVIVNWNSGPRLRECLMSIAEYKQRYLNHIIVIDNASTDDSLNKIEKIGLPILLVKNKLNIGFGAACNQGAKSGNSNFLLFLNPDTRLFKNTLDKSIDFMKNKRNSNVGILGVQLVGEHGEVLRTCARFPVLKQFFFKFFGLNRLSSKLFEDHFMNEWDHKGPGRMVDQIMGAFFLTRRNVFKLLNGFDERFFVFFEEVDFSLRALNLGFSSYYMPEIKAFHEGGGSTKKNISMSLFYSLQSRLLYAFKHFGFISAFALLLLTLIVEPISRIIGILFFGQDKSIKNLFFTYLYLFKNLPSLFLKIIKFNQT